MTGGGFTRMVQVSGKSVEITVYQKSKTVWEAIGDFASKPYRSTGRSLTQAESAWVQQVQYHYHQN